MLTNLLDPDAPYPRGVDTMHEILAFEARCSTARIHKDTMKTHTITARDTLADPVLTRRNYTPLEVREVRADKREVDFVCSTDRIDSYGTKLDQTSWNLKRFRANPAVLYAHNSRELPIGQARNVRLDGGKLVATIWFSEVTARAREVFQLVQEGTLRGISVGFDFGSYREERVSKDETVIVLCDLELIELSITPTPANADCIARLRSRMDAPIIPPAPIAKKKTEEQELQEFNDSLKGREAEARAFFSTTDEDDLAEFNARFRAREAMTDEQRTAADVAEINARLEAEADERRANPPDPAAQRAEYDRIMARNAAEAAAFFKEVQS